MSIHVILSEIPKREIKDLKSYEKKLLPEGESSDSDESEMITHKV